MRYDLTGISTPFGGISWDKTLGQKERMQFLFTYLESKRILYNPTEMEKKDWCILSVLEIKQSLVEVIKDVVLKKPLLESMNMMIDTCNEYLDEIESLNLPHIIYKRVNQIPEISFYNAMNKFREGMKISIENIEKEIKIKFRKELPIGW